MRWPVPSFFDASKVDAPPYIVDYEGIFDKAEAWSKQHGIKPSQTDSVPICLMPIDVQLAFCSRNKMLYVGGRSGTGALDDTVRLCEFIYGNLGVITDIFPTMDTHTLAQIFHRYCWLDQNGLHPASNATMISEEDVKAGRWRLNPAVVHILAPTADGRGNYAWAQKQALHYVQMLALGKHRTCDLPKGGDKYQLMIWTFHAMLGGVDHALVPLFWEACVFHSVARGRSCTPEIKGGNPLTENYSVLSPEVLDAWDGLAPDPSKGIRGRNGTSIAERNSSFFQKLIKYAMIIVAGQAKSHCLLWTIADLIDMIYETDPALAGKVYIMEDCTSPVVIPGVIDFTDPTNAKFDEFRSKGVHIVKSTDPIESWPNSPLRGRP